MTPTVQLHQGDCRDILPTIPAASVDCVITDPPYPEISRDYGRMSEPEWHAMMDVVVPECRRILKPTGSAVFVLQPNSERVGRMRPWLFEFQAKWCREWGMVQDIWWWNHAAPPTVHCHRDKGLARPSLKACVWLGPAECYRDQSAVLDEPAEATKRDKRTNDSKLRETPAGYTYRNSRRYTTFRERGGVTPFNVLPIANCGTSGSAAEFGHGAGTPGLLCNWWLRYICPPSGTVCDPYIGSGTVGIAAVKSGRSVIGIERMPKYHATAEQRIEAELASRAAQLIPA